MATNSNILLGKQGWGQNAYLSDQANINNFSSASLISDFANFDGMSDAINHSTLRFVLQTPSMFNVLGQRGVMIQAAIKNLWENHTVKLDGLQKRIEVDAYESEYGGGGEKIHTTTNVTRAQTILSTVHNDKRGRPIQRLLEFWIRFGVGDEYSKTPIVSLYDTNQKYNELLASAKSCIILNVAPNETKTKVDKSWLTFGVFPKSAGENIGFSDINVKGQGGQLNVEWFGTTQHGLGVDDLASRMLDRLNRGALNNALQPGGITDVDPETDELTTGIIKQMTEKYNENYSYTENII